MITKEIKELPKIADYWHIHADQEKKIAEVTHYIDIQQIKMP